MRDPNTKLPRKIGGAPKGKEPKAKDWAAKPKEKDAAETAPTGERKPFVHTGATVGRNDPCPCGSGKKFKKCHMGNEEQLAELLQAKATA